MTCIIELNYEDDYFTSEPDFFEDGKGLYKVELDNPGDLFTHYEWIEFSDGHSEFVNKDNFRVLRVLEEDIFKITLK